MASNLEMNDLVWHPRHGIRFVIEMEEQEGLPSCPDDSVLTISPHAPLWHNLATGDEWVDPEDLIALPTRHLAKVAQG